MNTNETIKKPLINKDSIKWIIGLTLFWPVSQLLVFLVRFGHLPSQMLTESLYFVPLGFISALMLVYFQNRSQTRTQYLCTTGGYILLIPLAFVASLLSGLILPPLIGPLIYGLIPLAVGVVGGFFAGKLFQ